MLLFHMWILDSSFRFCVQLAGSVALRKPGSVHEMVNGIEAEGGTVEMCDIKEEGKNTGDYGFKQGQGWGYVEEEKLRVKVKTWKPNPM